MGFTSVKDATAYTIYMMFGSYFKKAVCTSKIKENKLKVAYKEQKRDNQIRLEERCEDYIEQHIVSEVPTEIFEDMVEVRFYDYSERGAIVTFTGFDWVIKMWAEEKYKCLNFHYEYTKK